MGLKGRLEDLPLLDMLQIIAFSRKSGFLRIAAAKGRGAVVLREGRVLFAYSWSTVAGLEDMVRHPETVTTEIIKEQIEVALRELGTLREGHFQFELADPTSDEFGGVRIQPFLLQEGLDAQELLLDLAVEIDSERRETTSLLELAFQGDLPPEAAPRDQPLPPAPAPVPTPVATPPVIAPPRSTVVIVDDEAPVREVVSEELSKRGYRTFAASNPGSGTAIVQERAAAGEPVMIVVDLKMPTSSERSFFGGFELIRKVHRNHPGIPVLLMADTISEKAKMRAKELGIRRLVFKPTLSKIDSELYVQDLRNFAGAMSEQLEKLQRDHALAGNGRAVDPGAAADASRVEFLSTMTKKLVEPGGSADVSRLVMDVATRFLERGVLFVVKGDLARGLAAFGVGRSAKECLETAQNLSVEIANTPAFAEVVRRGAAYRLSSDMDDLEVPIFRIIGRARASEAVLIPLLYNRSTLLLLYGDNAASGRALADLSGLELFIAQAGMALENKLLQRKLSVVNTDLASASDDAESTHA
jgi:CheY-like chemotaxis protein